ncbi:galactose-specific lectin nattectin-like [Scomber scombrus]|uniref:galactose-specific lectin nattectin-like n=1 Tax=Scomber scombrus TaxID=13677 RepID=UPI002DD9448B|nr:galactose-specific lectin nattectin-like [Scomber scombrus]
MLRTSVVEAAAQSYGQKVIGACQGGNLRTCWWTTAVKEAIKLKKEGWPRGLLKQQRSTNRTKKLSSGVDEIHPEMLKALDIVWLPWLTCLFNVTWRMGTVAVDLQTEMMVPIFQKQGPEDCHVCPPGWTQFENHCYVFGHVEKDWADAEHACTLSGGNLASIPNTKVYNFIRDIIHRLTGKHTVAWVGGYDATKEGVWLWSDGSKFDFKGWSSGEPNNAGGHENCLEINFREKDLVNDVNCGLKRSFVCAKSL